MTEFPHTFGRVQPGQALGIVAAVVERAPGFAYRWQSPVHMGCLNRKKFPPREELVTSELAEFTALAEHGGSPADAIQRFSEFGPEWYLAWNGQLSDEKTDLGVHLRKGLWTVFYEVPSFNPTSALAFFREISARMALPLRIRGERIFDLEHTSGLGVNPNGLPQRVQWDLPNGSAAAAIQFLTDFAAALNLTPRKFGWSAGPPKGVAREAVPELYDTLIARQLPQTAAVLLYDFALPSLESIEDVHAQCQKPSDEFLLQIGSWELEPGVTVKLADEVKKKGHRFSLTVQDERGGFTRKAAKELMVKFIPVLEPR